MTPDLAAPGFALTCDKGAESSLTLCYWPLVTGHVGWMADMECAPFPVEASVLAVRGDPAEPRLAAYAEGDADLRGGFL